MIDINADIIPWESIGGIRLYSTIKELKNFLKDESKIKTIVFHNLWIRYEVEDILDLFFLLTNGKLFKITTLKNYKGKLFDKIYVGLPEDDLLKVEPSFVYDDFEEVYTSETKGIFLETDPNPNGSTVRYITVYVKELFQDDFEEGN
jgi:hypothetical protein